MTRTIRRVARLGTVILATGAIAAIAPTAHADTAPLTIDEISCESGASRYFCYASTSGGVGPVTVKYSPAAGGRCTANTIVRLTVVATDATGASVSRNKGFFCFNGPWP